MSDAKTSESFLPLRRTVARLGVPAARLILEVEWRGRISRRWSRAVWLGRQLRELKTATGERLPDKRIAAIVRDWDSRYDKPLSGRELMKALRNRRKSRSLEGKRGHSTF